MEIGLRRRPGRTQRGKTQLFALRVPSAPRDTGELEFLLLRIPAEIRNREQSRKLTCRDVERQSEEFVVTGRDIEGLAQAGFVRRRSQKQRWGQVPTFTCGTSSGDTSAGLSDAILPWAKSGLPTANKASPEQVALRKEPTQIPCGHAHSSFGSRTKSPD